MKGLALVPTLLLLLLSSRECFAADVDVFLQQSWVLGSTRTTLAKDALKFEMLDKQAMLLSTAPSWQLIYINNLKKCYSICAPEKFKLKFAYTNALFRPSATNAMHVRGFSKSTVSGFACTKVTLAETETNTDASKGRTWEGLLAKSADLCVAEDYPLPISKAVDQCFSIATVKGIPLTMTVTKHNGSKNEEIKVMSYKKRPRSANDFAIPKSFKMVASPEEAAKSTADEDMQELFH